MGMLRGRFNPSVSAAAVLLVAGLAVMGCSEDSTRPSDTVPAAEIPTLEGDTGGLTSRNEEPAFGDEALAASAAAETPIADAVAGDPEVIRWSEGDSARTYAVTLLWGILASDPIVDSRNTDSVDVAPVDWSGYLEVNRGAVIVRSTIDFERDDSIVRPRASRTRVDWISHTGLGFDGLRILVHQPMPLGETGERDSVSIVAGGHTWQYAVNDLADLDQVEAIDGLGNKFSVRSFLVGPGPCTQGFLGGVWFTPPEADSMGTFLGRWLSRTGEVTGFVRGHYGSNDRGLRVLFGKWVDTSGSFQGFLRGTWTEAGRDEGTHFGGRARLVGSFGGEILDGEEQPIGAIRGRWRSTRGGFDGVFDGVWSKGCALP